MDESGYYAELEVMTVPVTVTDFEIEKAPPVVQDTVVNHERRLKKLEKANTGAITVYNIWKVVENQLAKLDRIDVYAQGTGTSALYGKAT